MINKIFLIICAFLAAHCAAAQKRYLVFANGYRGFCHDHYTTQNEIYEVSPAGAMSPHGYWLGFDTILIARFQPITPLYIDGHHPVATSSHRSKIRAGWSWLVTRFGWLGHSNWGFNDEANEEGFQLRYENGRRCGERFLGDFVQSHKLDTLDMVCHSMGYAYALGFLEVVNPRIVLGKILIMAPESPGLRGMDWNLFHEVWQYGSNRFEEDALVTCRQDGIAPQCAVLGLEALQPEKGGRLFIPKGAKMGFVRSHHLRYWDWLYWIKKGDRGWFGR
jgi:hypothetical protein